MKYYVREGRRFVQTKPLKGMFLNNDGTFTKNKTNKSIGICVHDDFNETIIASLTVSKYGVSYDVAESACKAAFPFREGHIPTSYELLMLENVSRAKCEYHNRYLWVSDPCLINPRAYCLYFSNGIHAMYYIGKDYKKCNVIPFLTIKK